DKQSFNNKSTNEITMPILFDIEEDEIVREYEKVETFFGLCQEYATILHFPAEVDDEVINNLRVDLSEEIDKKNNEIFKEQEIKFNTSIALHKQQEEAYFYRKIRDRKSVIDNYYVELINTSDENE